MNKFKNNDEYLEWCESVVNRIYYAAIAMNDSGIRDVISEVRSKLHICEGDQLIAVDGE